MMPHGGSPGAFGAGCCEAASTDADCPTEAVPAAPAAFAVILSDRSPSEKLAVVVED
jgi:hypothetical protein